MRDIEARCEMVETREDCSAHVRRVMSGVWTCFKVNVRRL